METIKPFDVDSMRVKASVRIHTMFKGAPFIYVKYRGNYAEDYCQYKDGVIATFTVWYRDMLVCTSMEELESAHDRAQDYIKSIPERPWAS